MDFEVIMLDMPNMVRNKNIAHLSATFNVLVFNIYISIKILMPSDSKSVFKN